MRELTVRREHRGDEVVAAAQREEVHQRRLHHRQIMSLSQVVERRVSAHRLLREHGDGAVEEGGDFTHKHVGIRCHEERHVAVGKRVSLQVRGEAQVKRVHVAGVEECALLVVVRQHSAAADLVANVGGAVGVSELARGLNGFTHIVLGNEEETEHGVAEQIEEVRGAQRLRWKELQVDEALGGVVMLIQLLHEVVHDGHRNVLALDHVVKEREVLVDTERFIREVDESVNALHFIYYTSCNESETTGDEYVGEHRAEVVGEETLLN